MHNNAIEGIVSDPDCDIRKMHPFDFYSSFYSASERSLAEDDIETRHLLQNTVFLNLSKK